MRNLSNFETSIVNGAGDPAVALGAGLITGSVAAYMVSHVPGLSTVAGTVVLGGTGAVLGTLAFPIVGTFFGGCVGGLTGYMVSSTLAPVVTFCGVAGVTAFAVTVG